MSGPPPFSAAYSLRKWFPPVNKNQVLILSGVNFFTDRLSRAQFLQHMFCRCRGDFYSPALIVFDTARALKLVCWATIENREACREAIVDLLSLFLVVQRHRHRLAASQHSGKPSPFIKEKTSDSWWAPRPVISTIPGAA
jgi:hypothetical protein